MLHCVFISLLDCVFTGNFVGVCWIGLGVQKPFTKFYGVRVPKRLRNTVISGQDFAGNHGSKIVPKKRSVSRMQGSERARKCL